MKKKPLKPVLWLEEIYQKGEGLCLDHFFAEFADTGYEYAVTLIDVKNMGADVVPSKRHTIREVGVMFCMFQDLNEVFRKILSNGYGARVLRLGVCDECKAKEDVKCSHK